MANLKVYELGDKGVNVDGDPIAVEDTELMFAQNAIRDPLGAGSGLRKRPGLAAANSNIAGGAVLGGIGVPVINLSTGGLLTIYVGRGPM